MDTKTPIILLSLALIITGLWAFAHTAVKHPLILKSIAGSLFAQPAGFRTANSALYLHRAQLDYIGARGIGRTANAALVASILAAATPAPYVHGAELPHGTITTANASMFVQAHFSEPETRYAIGWKDPDNFDAAAEFIAPALMPTGERFEYITYPNAEAFLSDASDDDLRAIGADFKTVEYTEDKATQTIPNRGLRAVVDWDRIKNTPNWQQLWTARLLQRLKRNAFRRKYALAVAAGTGAGLTWDAAGAADPDLDIVNQMLLSSASSGITPNRAMAGVTVDPIRMACYGASNTPKGYAGRAMTLAQALAKAGLQPLVDASQYQTGATKARIVGTKIIMFNAQSMSGEDPSNFKTAIGSTEQGGRYAVYVRQLTVKQWEIVVETYETEWCATVLGARTLSVSAT